MDATPPRAPISPNLKDRSRLCRFIINRTRWLRGEIQWLLWALCDRHLASFWLRRMRCKQVVFVASNELALRQFELFSGLFEDDARIRFTVADSPRGIANRKRVKTWCLQRGVRYLPFGRARWRPWHLMVFADHDQMDRFPAFVPKVRLGHGIGGSKLIEGVPYRHATEWVEHRGRPFYTRMFEASEHSVAEAVRHNPKLRGIAVAVGDLPADHMLSLRPQREDIRRSFGYANGDLVILVQSTYGPTSLMETVGSSLVTECVRLARNRGWKFILQTHPHHWKGPRSKEHPWGRFLLEQEGKPGIRVIHPEEDWAPFLVASDMAITDHTSLCMTYALLGQPILYVDVPGTTLETGGNPGWDLARILPGLSGVDRLAEDICRARFEFPRDQVAEIAKEILSCPCEAAMRIRTEVYGLLKLGESGVTGGSG